VHGPKGNRDFSFKVNRKAVRKANRCVLSAKMQENKIFVVDTFAGCSGKTKEMLEILKKIDIGKGALLIDGLDVHPKVKQGTGNIMYVHAVSHLGMSPHMAIKHDTLILTKAAVKLFEDRFIAKSTYWPNYLDRMPGWKEADALSRGLTLEEAEEEDSASKVEAEQVEK
jgi:ribosomal protein L4